MTVSTRIQYRSIELLRVQQRQLRYSQKRLAVLFTIFVAFTSAFDVQAQDCTVNLTTSLIQHPTCGGSDGIIYVETNGSITPPYQYTLAKEINGSFVSQLTGTKLVGSIPIIMTNDLSGGTYKVLVAKSSTCRGEITVPLEQKPLSLTTSLIQQPTCGGSDGIIYVETNGSITPPYQYTLAKQVNGSFVSQLTGTKLMGSLPVIMTNDLSAGIYKVLVVKGSTCSGEITVPLEQPPLSLTTSFVQQPTCGGSDGIIYVETNGSITPPYQYTLAKQVNGNFVSQLTGSKLFGSLPIIMTNDLSAGTYKVLVAKGSTCSGEITVPLEQKPLNLTTSFIQQPTCGGSDGIIYVEPNGSITPPYQYTLAKQVNGNFMSQLTGTKGFGSIPIIMFTGLSAGTYKALVAKSNTCSGEITVYLTPCEIAGNEGCGPGYWKSHLVAWGTTNFSPAQTLESVFDVPNNLGLDNTTLLQSLQDGGGSGLVGAAKILLRAAITALLNASHPDVDYPITQAQLLTEVNAALSSGNRKSMLQLATTLDNYNNSFCPIDAQGNVTSQGARLAARTSLPEVVASGLSLKVGPNPSTGAFTVQIESNSIQPITLRIVDLQGRLIEQRQQLQPNQRLTIGDHYSPGLYLFEAQQGTNRKQLRLLKMSN